MIEKQIIWFYGRTPTIIVCVKCEKIADYLDETCKECGDNTIEFTCDPLEYSDALDTLTFVEGCP